MLCDVETHEDIERKRERERERERERSKGREKEATTKWFDKEIADLRNEGELSHENVAFKDDSTTGR